MLVEKLLTKEETAIVQKICKVLMSQENKALKRDVVRAFRVYLETSGREELEGHEPARLLTRYDTYRYDRRVEFYDFLRVRMPAYLSGLTGKAPQAILGHIRALEGMRTESGFLTFLRPETQQHAKQDLSPVFSGTFLGYRLSTRLGEVIRFAIEITSTPNSRIVEYRNYYERKDRCVKSEGRGIQLGDTLYLFGDAWNADDPKEQLGLRIFALRRWRPGSEHVTGLIISHDTAAPIAARVVLVPGVSHVFEAEGPYARFHDNPVTTFEDARSVISIDREYCNSDRYREFLEMAEKQFYDLVESATSDDIVLNLFHFINNISNTTIIGANYGMYDQSQFHGDRLYEREFALASFEFFQMFATQRDQDPKDVITEMVSNFWIDKTSH